MATHMFLFSLRSLICNSRYITLNASSRYWTVIMLNSTRYIATQYEHNVIKAFVVSRTVNVLLFLHQNFTTAMDMICIIIVGAYCPMLTGNLDISSLSYFIPTTKYIMALTAASRNIPVIPSR